jgi:parallel beta-helix repeat protein/predicted outer membrane repeat protein
MNKKQKLMVFFLFVCCISLAFSSGNVSAADTPDSSLNGAATDTPIVATEVTTTSTPDTSVQQSYSLSSTSENPPETVSDTGQTTAVPDPKNTRTNIGYTTIQAAIADPLTLDGDTILVETGIYYEHDITVTKSLTIQGAGVETTFVDGQNLGRIFLISPGKTVVISGLTLQNGEAADFGGAIYNQGTLTVKDNVFTGNSAILGGAIMNGYAATLNVENNTFTGNSAIAGGAIFNSNGIMTVTSNNFINNTTTAGGAGGAIYNYYTTAVIHFNRFVGNTASFGNVIFNDNGTVDAENNWWGSNANPSGQVMNNLGTLDTDPWLKFNLYANSPVNPTETSLVTADLTQNSNGADTSGQGHVPDGIVADFMATMGTIATPSVTVNGKATAPFQAGNAGGLASIQATVDNEIQNTAVTIDGLSIWNITTNEWFSTIQAAIDDIDTSDNDLIYLFPQTYYEYNIIVNKSLTIGGITTGIVIDAQQLGRIFTITSGEAVYLFNITLQNGLEVYGGAIANEGNLTVDTCNLISNTAIYGGAIWNDGYLTVQNSTFTVNTAKDQYGGAIYNNEFGVAYIYNSGFFFNSASYGGAIYNAGTLDVYNNSIFIGNLATNFPYQENPLKYGAGGCGGAIYNYYGNLGLYVSTFIENMATYNHVVDDFVQGDGGYGGALYNYYGNVNLDGNTFNANVANYNRIVNGVAKDGFSGYGGAIYSYNGSLLTVNYSTFNGNSAGSSGGAIYDEGALSVNNSTFTGNWAGQKGGAIYNLSADSLFVSYSTFTANIAKYGGAIYNIGTLNVYDSTFLNNSAFWNGGAIWDSGNAEIHFNRFLGNSAYSGSALYCAGGIINAQNNWWGSNANPKTVPGLIGGLVANVNIDPWLFTVINTTTLEIFNTIQSAIDDPDTLNGDTLEVNGILTENVLVYKQLAIISPYGTYVATVQALNSLLPVFEIIPGGDFSTIQGFTITGATSSYGVLLNAVSFCNIIGNDINNNSVGIYDLNGSDNLILANYIHQNNAYGIILDGSFNNTIGSNDIYHNGAGGIFASQVFGSILPAFITINSNYIYDNGTNGMELFGLIFSTITNNNVTGNGKTGIYTNGSWVNQISGNQITNNGLYGMILDGSSYNTIDTNNISQNGLAGIFSSQVTFSSLPAYNTITNNQITNNGTNGIEFYGDIYSTISFNYISNNVQDGIFANGSWNNVFNNNNLVFNGNTGIYLDNCFFNTIYYNNFVDNPQQAFDNEVTNTNVWDDGISLGNFWSDWPFVMPRPIAGGNNFDYFPSLVPF